MTCGGKKSGLRESIKEYPMLWLKGMFIKRLNMNPLCCYEAYRIWQSARAVTEVYKECTPSWAYLSIKISFD